MRDTSRFVQDVCRANLAGNPVGIASVCSANPRVLKTAMESAASSGTPLCIESTSNQVNQFGGYTGMKPESFAKFTLDLASETGFAREALILGGDHLGPFPWRGDDAGTALVKACELVRDCVRAGYLKIHLDASMPCGGDPTRLDDEVIVERAAHLCLAAEEEHSRLPAESPLPVFVIGTEVPVPGGETDPESGLVITRPEDVEKMLALSRDAFLRRGLHSAWERVLAVVVQPGVDFSDGGVVDYDPAKAEALSRLIERSGKLVYEAHSTDYQSPESLERLVADHFAVLKVGPWLTFAFREAVFALSLIEEELLSRRKGGRLSGVREALEAEMLRDPRHWTDYYPGDDEDRRLARSYSLSDRSRYYWPQPAVDSALSSLVQNLSDLRLPLGLLSQYLPLEYESVRRGDLTAHPEALIGHSIGRVLAAYTGACGGERLRRIWDDQSGR